MPNMDDALSIDALFSMFKGEPGSRKSTQALSYPTPQYWFSVDQKMRALTIPMKKWGIDAKQIEYDNYTAYNPIRARLEKLQESCPYRTIILDSITSIADVTNRQTIKAKTGTTTKTGDEKGMRVGGIAVNTMEDYKAEASAFQEIMALCKDIHQFHKCHIIMIAHVIGERDKAHSAGSSHFARIICTGGKIISAKIPAYCEEVYHFDVETDMDLSKEGTYALMTRHNGDDFARTSLPLKGRIVFGDDPLYEKWIKPAMKEIKEQQPVQKF